MLILNMIKKSMWINKPIIDGKADVVYGSIYRQVDQDRYYFGIEWVILYLLIFGNILTNLNLSDMETCYKAIKSSYFKKLNIRENRFGIEPEITIKLAKMKCRFYEIGINYYGRDYSEGKKITWKDGLSAIFCIIKYSLFSKIDK